MKKCIECKLEKDDISKNGKCKQCNNKYMRQYREKNSDKIKKYQKEYGSAYYEENKKQILQNKSKYYEENKENILEDRKEYYQENREEKLGYNKEYYQKNRDYLLEDAKEYYKQNKDNVIAYNNKYYKKRRLNDHNFRIRTGISASIAYYLKANNSSKNGASCLDYLPFTINELRQHLEVQFEPWMTWNNYGRYNAKNWNDNDLSTWRWNIDHIIPQSKLLYTSMEDDNFKRCWALENLRPLSAKQNFLDGVKRTRH